MTIWEYNLLTANPISKAAKAEDLVRGSCITGHQAFLSWVWWQSISVGTYLRKPVWGWGFVLCWEVVDCMDNYYGQKMLFIGEPLRPGKTNQQSWTLPLHRYPCLITPQSYGTRECITCHSSICARLDFDIHSLFFPSLCSHPQVGGKPCSSLLCLIPPDLKLETGEVCADQSHMFSRSSPSTQAFSRPEMDESQDKQPSWDSKLKNKCIESWGEALGLERNSWSGMGQRRDTQMTF